MKRQILAAGLALGLIAALPGVAFAQELAVGGQIVGIQISTRGVMVAGLGSVETAEGSRSPAKEAGIHEGDFVTAVNGREVDSAGALIAAVGELQGASAELSLLREEKSLCVTITPVLSKEDQWMLGMWLRDGISGIGTVTFCDPATGTYGALGHSVSDEKSGQTLPMSRGSITEAEVVDVVRGAVGAPGELNGCSDVGRVLGSVEKNTDHGIYGHVTAPLGGRIVETGTIDLGPATILSTVSGREAKEYRAEVTRLYKDGDGLHAMIVITDSELRDRTGGIVQGMSGSPVLQDGKLVAAITHVSVLT